MHLFFLFLSNFVAQSPFVNPKIKVQHEESHHGLLTNYSLRYLMEDYAKKVDCYESLTNYSLRYCAKKYILQHADLPTNKFFLLS